MEKWDDNAKKLLNLCIEEINYLIEEKELSITNRQLMSICREFADYFSFEIDPHIYHEITETALNLLIKNKYAAELLALSKPEILTREIIKPLTGRLPTQTWRSSNQIVRQQFSTPPTLAYFLTYLLNLQKNEFVLEPSAGTGSLACWTSGFGLETHANEVDERRQALLGILGFMPTGFNAEFIHDFLSLDVNPDVLVMNPPFSSNGGRTATHSSKFGFRHVESALERLKKGGKFGIILGNSASLDTATGRAYWQKISEKNTVRAIIKIAGAEYAKNGTRVDVNLIVGKKNLVENTRNLNFDPDKIICISAKTVEDGFIEAKQRNIRLY